MEKELLKLLLDKYEKSRHATGEARIRRRVTVKTSELSGYHQRDIEYRKSLHRAALHLEQAGVLAIEWVPGETGNLIPKERLRAVPHATLSIDAKKNQK